MQELPYNLNELTWDKDHLKNKQDKYCYCGNGYTEDKPMIRCSTCQQLFHGDCVQCLPKPLLFGDNFGTFTCSICNGGTESYERKGLSWIIIVHLVIYNLIKKAQIEDSKKPEKDRREHYYFRWKEDVCAFIDDYWDYLLPDKQRSATWNNTIASVLSTHSNIFLSGFEKFKQSAWWTLHKVEPPTGEKKTKAGSRARPNLKKPLKRSQPVEETTRPRKTRKTQDIKKQTVKQEQQDLIDLSSLSELSSAEEAFSDNESTSQVKKDENTVLLNATPPIAAQQSVRKLSQVPLSENSAPASKEPATPRLEDSSVEDGKKELHIKEKEKEQSNAKSNDQIVVVPIKSDPEESSLLDSKSLGTIPNISSRVAQSLPVLQSSQDEWLLLQKLEHASKRLPYSAARYKRKLAVRRLKRNLGIKLFDLDNLVLQSLRAKHALEPIAKHTVIQPTANQQQDENNSTQDAQQLLDKITFTPYSCSFASRLYGSIRQRNTITRDEAWLSSWNGRKLRPFIWRNFETKPTRMLLMAQIRLCQGRPRRRDQMLVEPRELDIICQVRALYPYEPKDPSALSFKANAIIDVFAQLESGWWDGCCEGRRGWFPSNYVEILKQAPSGRRTLTDQHMKEQLRLSLHASDMILNKSNAPVSSSSSHSNNQSEWILQTTEDGSEQYYYNIRTHEMRHSLPPEGYVTTEEEDDLIPPARPVRAANRMMEGSSQLLDDVYDKLPPGWMRKITPQGRYYYCNPETEETTWELENIDPDTGMLIPSQPNSPPSSPSEISFDLKDTPITWSTLSAMIAHAIHNLKECIQAGKTTYIRQESAQVVQRIRLLLYVSNCLDKESSVHLKSNKQLRAVHRNLLASVAKLILSAKMTSSAWPSPEALGKLMNEAEEILVSVRHFMTWAQDMRIELKEKAGPTLAVDRPLWKNPIQVNSQHYHRAMLSGQPDAVTAIMVLADNVRGAISSFMESIRDAYSHIHNDQDIKSTLRKLKANAPLLVAQFRNLSNTTSQFMNTVEQVHEDDNLKSVAIMKAKHPIYAAMGSLFVVTQQITNSGMDIVEAQAAYDRINEAVQAIENGIENAVDYSQMDEEEIAEEVKTEDEEVKEEEQQEQPKPSSSSNPSPVKDVKIAKFFGEDPPPPPPRNSSPTTPSSPSAGVPATNTQGEVPWFLAADIDPNEIALNVEGQVKGGTLHGLVKRLTQHDQFDAKFNTTFLLTYRSFCSTEELFNELFQRYQLQPPEELTAEEREQWSERKLKLIRLRVFNVIKSWLETYYNEEEDRPILLELSQFTDHVISHSMKFGAEQLTRLIKKRMLAEESGQIRKMKLNSWILMNWHDR
ncbi:hypothetical protein RMATCC62417_14940 [Rhizopus microsporus]|nr:hypothetical protein RMATCC62417_14940 [Rhizopus microsporus]